MVRLMKGRLTAEEPQGGRHAWGRVQSDPAAGISVGDAIHFRSQQFPTQLKGEFTGFNTIDNWGYFRGTILIVTFRTAAGTTAEGTAFMVAPGIALTASHTFHGHHESLATGATACYLQGIFDDQIMIWELASFTVPNNCDIAILCLRAASPFPPDRTYWQSWLTTRTPAVGETVTVVGFRVGDAALEDGDPPSFTFEGHAYVGRGPVSAVYDAGRDRVMLPWPCFEISTNAVGAMSGAPVFDAQGLVVGVLSTSLESEQDDGPAFASLIWPSLISRVQPAWPRGFIKSHAALIDLDPLICQIAGREALTVEHGELSSNGSYARWTGPDEPTPVQELLAALGRT
jgi:hypothetical protein